MVKARAARLAPAHVPAAGRPEDVSATKLRASDHEPEHTGWQFLAGKVRLRQASSSRKKRKWYNTTYTPARNRGRPGGRGRLYSAVFSATGGEPPPRPPRRPLGESFTARLAEAFRGSALLGGRMVRLFWAAFPKKSPRLSNFELAVVLAGRAVADLCGIR